VFESKLLLVGESQGSASAYAIEILLYQRNR
jgi:hypothetical protein